MVGAFGQRHGGLLVGRLCKRRARARTISSFGRWALDKLDSSTICVLPRLCDSSRPHTTTWSAQDMAGQVPTATPPGGRIFIWSTITSPWRGPSHSRDRGLVTAWRLAPPALRDGDTSDTMYRGVSLYRCIAMYRDVSDVSDVSR